MGLLNLTESKGGETDLNECTIVQDLVISRLLADDLTHVGLHHEVTGLSEFVVNSEVVYLLEGSTHTLSWITPGMYHLHKLINHISAVVLDAEDIALFILGKSELDGVSDNHIFVVEVVDHDDSDSRLVFGLFPLGQVLINAV